MVKAKYKRGEYIMWYEKSLRRHLCDMHIDDWDEVFLSQFTPEMYYNNLMLAKVQTAMIYFQSHVGYSYYPTESGHMHNAFIGREDAMKQLVDLCHSGGIQVVGYYSLIYNNWAYTQFPASRMIDMDGKTAFDKGGRYGFCCPNSLEYRSFVVRQLQEMADYFEFEGMFFDMPFWQHPCYCPSCQNRWESEVGGTLPTVENLKDENWCLHIEKRQQWMGDFTSFVSKEMKKIKPNVTVVMNFATSICSNTDSSLWCTNLVNDACDYSGGDLYGGLLEQSVACKFYRNITKNQPFEYMTCRCNPDLLRHTITKSKDKLTVTSMITCAHHGAMLVIDAIDPVGTMNKKAYTLIGEIFGNEMQYEPYLKGEMIEDFAVFYNILRKGNLQGQNFGAHTGAINTSKTLIESHIPFCVVSNDNLDGLHKYKLLFIPYANTISDENINKIISYVENGGNLYFSGAEEPTLLKNLLNAKKSGYTDETVTYIAPKKKYETLFENYSSKYPLPFDYRLPVIEGVAEAEMLATIVLPYTKQDEQKFASIHSNPPGILTDIPAVVMKKYGQGNVIWSAAPLEEETILDYKKVLLNLIYTIQPKETFSILSDAPKNVELVSFNCDNETLISVVSLSEDDEISSVAGFTITVKSDINSKEVVLLPSQKAIDFSYDGEYISFKTEDLHIFDMYKIKF